MEKKDLLHHCRYYSGGDGKRISDPDKQTFYKVEKEWVNLVLNQNESEDDLLSLSLSEYIMAGLKDFEKYDDTPLSLKALLYNRFTKYNERIDIGLFKKWYHKYARKGEK